MAKKNAIGKGKDRRFIVRYDVYTKSGERKQKQKTFKSSKVADEFIAQVTLIQKGNEDLLTLVQNQKKDKKEKTPPLPFDQYAENWMNVDYYSRVRPTTFKNGGYYLYSHLIPFFGQKSLHDITGDDIRQLYAGKKREGFSEKTISGMHKFLSALFHAAVEKEVLEGHPMSKIKKKPKDPIRIAEPWSYTEIAQFLQVAEQEKKDLMYDFTLSTGLRQGEVFALPWFNIDFDQNTVTVTRSVSYDEKGKPELIPKSQDSYRTISLSLSLVKKLKEHKENQEAMKKRFGEHYHHELDLVFPKSDGGFLDPSNVRRELYRLMAKANVRRITFHDLRHTHSSMLIRSGANPRIVQRRLGHKDIQTTFRYYGHLWPNADKEAIESLALEMEKHKSKLHEPEKM